MRRFFSEEGGEGREKEKEKEKAPHTQHTHRRRDDDFGLGPQVARLRLQRQPAHRERRPDVRELREGADHRVHLRRELARRLEDQDVRRGQPAPARAAAAAAAAEEQEALEEREGERGGLARAGDGGARDVAAEEGQRDARGLTGKERESCVRS